MKALSINKKQKKGMIFGFGSPLFYAFDSVLDILLFALVFGAAYRSGLSLWQTITYSFVTSFIKDFMLYLFMEIRQKGKTIKKFIHLARTKKRAFWWTVGGSLSGGPLGFTLTTATILYSGAAYGSALANFSPVIVLLFAVKFFKTKLNWKSWLGVIMALGGFLGLSFYSSFISGSSFAFDYRVFIGVILAILAVLTWSVETIVAEYVEKFGEKESLNDNEKLSIKSITSSSVTLTFFLPLSFLLAYATNDWMKVTNMFNNLLTSWETYVILFVIGLIIVFGRSSYWYAISRIGGSRADILYYLTVLFTPLLVLILAALNVNGFSNLKGVDQVAYWILLFIQMTGVMLITFFSNNNKEHIFKRKDN